MVWSKLLKCFPGKFCSYKHNPRIIKPLNRSNDDFNSAGRRRQKAKEADSESSDENDAFNSKQKAKAVAVVLSGYDTEIAAASVRIRNHNLKVCLSTH